MKQRSLSDVFMDKLLSEYKALTDYVKTDDTLEQELRMNIAFYAYEEKKNEQYRKLESQK